MLIQPILVITLLFVTGVYFARLRAKIWDRLIVIVIAAVCMTLIIHPGLANRLAHMFGVGRGVDLVFYLALPGLAFVCLLLFSKLLTLQELLTRIVREIALLRAESGQDR
jgi:small membrane protein